MVVSSIVPEMLNFSSLISRSFWTKKINLELSSARQTISTETRKTFCSKDNLERLIIGNTVIHRSLMVPEISLRLITPDTKLWTAAVGRDDAEGVENIFQNDPFW